MILDRRAPESGAATAGDGITGASIPLLYLRYSTSRGNSDPLDLTARNMPMHRAVASSPLSGLSCRRPLIKASPVRPGVARHPAFAGPSRQPRRLRGALVTVLLGVFSCDVQNAGAIFATVGDQHCAVAASRSSCLFGRQRHCTALYPNHHGSTHHVVDGNESC